MEQLSSVISFGGEQRRYRHSSQTLSCDMEFAVYLPPQAAKHAVPVVYWLSGLTCTDENFVSKAGAQRYATQYGLAIIAPDTSPRGDSVPDDAEQAYDVGLGAGFYVNATETPWATNYQMYDYVVQELPTILSQSDLPLDHSAVSLSGHSMGGHGALSIALKNSSAFQSVSAFSPICSPMRCPWGKKALSTYCGENRETWKQYDTVELLKQSKERLPVLVDQGDADNFLAGQLKTELLIDASRECDYPMRIRMQPGYDHSYYFIASFIGEHLQFHAHHLGVQGVPL